MALTVTTAELATYLGMPTIDEDRAALMLTLAADRCKAIVNPLPDGAKATVLSSAARGYANPQGVTQEAVGPYSASRPWAGIYLTKQERADLKRLAGVGGAFSINTMPDTAHVPYSNPWSIARAEEWARNRGEI